MVYRTLLSPRLAAARDDLSARRATRASREMLKGELASFTTSTDRHELDAFLDRADQQAADATRSLIPRLRAI